MQNCELVFAGGLPKVNRLVQLTEKALASGLSDAENGEFAELWTSKAEGFDATSKQLFINPEECIDCGACEPECPVDAIYDEDEIPDEYESSIDRNYKFFGQEAP